MSTRPDGNHLRGWFAAIGAVFAAVSCQVFADIPDVTFSEKCATYCRRIDTDCAGEHEQYSNERACLVACTWLDENDSSDSVSGNTIDCRLAQLNDLDDLRSKSGGVELDPTVLGRHCTSAGPGGGSVCGSSSEAPNCEGYCAIYARACGDRAGSDEATASVEQCVKSCADITPVRMGEYSTSVSPADDLGCRLFYATRAAVDPSAENCSSAAVQAQGRCVYSPTCKNYCRRISNACPSKYAQYPDERTCLRACTWIDEFNPSSSTEGSTIACRLEQVALAELTKGSPADLAEPCTAAGPGGSRDCTSYEDKPDCEGYCALYIKACGGRADNPFGGKDSTTTDLAKCVALCEAVRPIARGVYNASTEPKQDDLGCRLYYASRAVTDPSADNCNWAGLRPEGEGRCREEPSCSAFCRVTMVACQGADKVYDDETQCETLCPLNRKGSWDDHGAAGPGQPVAKQDSQGCKLAHAYNALLVAPPHCSHAGPLGAAVCIDGERGNCKAYCKLVKAACSDEYGERYDPDLAENSDCVDDCYGNLEGAEDDFEKPGGHYSVKDAEAGGNTVQCRALFASRAYVLADQASTRNLTDEEQSAKGTRCAQAFGMAPPCQAPE